MQLPNKWQIIVSTAQAQANKSNLKCWRKLTVQQYQELVIKLLNAKYVMALGGLNMDVNELIDKYQEFLELNISAVGGSVFRMSDLLNDLKDLSNLEYNRKVKVPGNVARWIEYCKAHGYSLKMALEYPTPDKNYQEAAKQWILSNESIFAQAWLSENYEVEEEPKWYVVNSDGRYFCNMGFSIKHSFISNVIWRRDNKFKFKTKEAAEAVVLLVGGRVEEVKHDS